jgi:hypothetical protein
MTSLTDRDAQLAALGASWARASSGAGQVVLLEGPVATGKTSLLRAFADSVGGTGARVQQASCAATERSLSLGVAGQLFLGIDLPEAFRKRTSALIEQAETGNTGILPGLCRELFELAAARPVLITVDDVQHADPTSSTWLVYLARRLAGAPVLLVLAGDLAEDSDFGATRAELLRLAHCTTTRVAPLSAHGVTELLTRRFGGPGAGQFAATFHAASGGNPLLLAALVEDRRAGRSEEYQQALRECARRCGPVAVRVAQAMALIGEPAEPSVVGAVLDLDVDVAGRAMRCLAAAGLLDGVLTGPGRAALLADLPVADRAVLHGRAARELAQRGAPATAVAAQIVASGGAASPECGGALSEAAQLHLLAGEIRAAVRCLAHAITHGADDHEATANRVRLAGLEWRADPVAAARRLGPLVAEARAGRLSAAEQVELCRQLAWHGRDDEAAVIIDRLCTSEDDEWRAFELWLSATHPRLVPPRRSPVPRRQSAQGARPRSAVVLADVLVHAHPEQAATRCEQLLQETELYQDMATPEESPVDVLLPDAGTQPRRTGWAGPSCPRWRPRSRCGAAISPARSSRAAPPSTCSPCRDGGRRPDCRWAP